MQIGLLSDTHNYLHPAIEKHFSEVDEIWHAGDIGQRKILDQLEKIAPTRAVFGNIDDASLRRELPEVLRFSINDVDIMMTHIGGYPGKYAPSVKNLIYENPPYLFISGHSHILKVQFDKTNNLLHINPGAAGINGFHRVSTIVRFNITNKIENLEVIEFPKKKQIT